MGHVSLVVWLGAVAAAASLLLAVMLALQAAARRRLRELGIERDELRRAISVAEAARIAVNEDCARLREAGRHLADGIEAERIMRQHSAEELAAVRDLLGASESGRAAAQQDCARLAEAERQLTQARDLARAECDQLTASIEDARRQLADAEAARSRVQEECARLQEVERRVGVSLEASQADRATAVESLAAERARAAGIAQDLAAAQEEGSRLREAERRLEATLSSERELRREAADSLARLQEEHGLLQRAHAALQADTDGKLASATREVAALRELRQELSKSFEEIAASTLRRTGADLSQAHSEKLGELLTPLREHVGRFEVELRSVHKSADEERARLAEQIRHLTQRSEAISLEATNLARALKGDKQRQGAWGEMILEGVLEASGLIDGVHYERQKSRTDAEGGRWRPDVVVRLPRGKCLVVDSKVSLVAYEAAASAETEEQRAMHLKAHVAAIRKHIDGLASKGYSALEDGSVDYVLMFMPIEGALSEAWRRQGDLTVYAASRGVGIVTPTTLMLALKTVDHIWTVERREQNAEAIAERAGRLYDKVAGFVLDMQRVGTAIASAAKSHDDAMGKLTSGRGNLLGQVDKLKQMGARTTKELAVPFDPEDGAGLILPAAE